MSIIYDALKKVEKSNTQGDNRPATKPHLNQLEPKAKLKIKPQYLLLILVGLIGAVAIVTITGKRLNSAGILQRKQETEIPPVRKVEVPTVKIEIPAPETSEQGIAQSPQGSPERFFTIFSLNGIFVSQDDSYALVNNKVVRKGDTVNGATILEIYEDGIDLQVGTKTFSLKSP
ncbi:hypothetical protein ACFLZ3_02885 [Candidatus Omnitrophota bacterium]